MDNLADFSSSNSVFPWFIFSHHCEITKELHLIM